MRINLIYFAKIMPTRGKKACFLFPECSLSYAKIMQGECNGKVVRRSLTKLDTAEPQLILCKDNANERRESLLFISRVQLILCKINNIAHVITIYLTKITYYKLSP